MPTKSYKSHPKKKAMIVALQQTMGNITQACKIVKIDRTTHYDWLDKDATYADAVANIPEMVLDFVEAQLLKNISKGKETSTIFYLKTKGKGRGYVEKQEREITVKEFPEWLKD